MRARYAARAVLLWSCLWAAGVAVWLAGCASDAHKPPTPLTDGLRTSLASWATPAIPPTPRPTATASAPAVTGTPTRPLAVSPAITVVTEEPIAPTPTVEPTPAAESVLARVVQVYDGDTIGVEIDGERYVVRYIGIDAPEPGQGYLGFEWLGPEATEFNRALVEGRVVRLERDVSETDKYGRLLRYVWAGDVFVNAALVREGFAEARAYPPDVRHQELFERLQAEAQAAQLGIWGPRPTATAQPEIGGPDCPYVGNANSGKFHHATCKWVAEMAPHNRVCLASREEAIAQGYEPCGWCKP